MITDPQPAAAPAATSLAARVKQQLSGDFPASSLGWVDSLVWRGPVTVPLRQIDRTSGAADWNAAAADRSKLNTFKAKIMRGDRKPVVLVKHPGSSQLLVVDGHARATVYLSLGQPIPAWVGTAPSDHGPWESLHSHQV